MIRLFLVCLLLAIASVSQAHNRSESFSQWHWQQDGVLRVSFTVLSREVSALPATGGNPHPQVLNQALVQHFTQLVTLKDARSGESCALLDQVQAMQARNGYSRLEARFQCATVDQLQLAMPIFNEVANNHVHYAMVSRKGQKSEYIFSSKNLTQSIFADASARTGQTLSVGHVVMQHLLLGMEHIVFGFDHLLFLLGILLLALCNPQAPFKTLAWLVTGFTLGHSLSLVAAVTGYASPNIPLVEIFIGFSIFILASEVVLNEGNRRAIFMLVLGLPIILAALRFALYGSDVLLLGLISMALFSVSYLALVHFNYVQGQGIKGFLTALFGLIHGFGFASSFLSMGFEGQHLLWKLLSFNIGVELGQILVLLLALLVIYSLKKYSLQWLANGALMLMSSMGIFWLLQRAIA